MKAPITWSLVKGNDCVSNWTSGLWGFILVSSVMTGLSGEEDGRGELLWLPGRTAKDKLLESGAHDGRQS